MAVERVLVVDDDEALLHLMALALRRRGYEVEETTDGFSALKVLAAEPPFSVLLTDLMMPGMSGLELLRQARKLDEHIQCVVVTAAPDLESAISAMRADGAYDYLLKPFESMSQLLMAVERAAEQRRLLIEREMLRSKVQREADRLRALITSTGDAIFSADADGSLQIANPAARRLIAAEQPEGEDGSAPENALPSTLRTLIDNWRAVGANLPALVEMNWPGGTIQMVSLTPIPESEGGARVGWVAVLRDITHVKHIEELKSQLLVEAAGHFRLPLAQAMNALVELNILTAQDERVREVVGRLTQTWKRIQEWGDDLNALLRLDSGIQTQIAKIDLSEVLRELRIRPTGELGKVDPYRLALEIEPDLPRVIGDYELIHRLLKGLINRALARSEENGTIRLNARSYNGQVWVSVSDDGPQVNDEDLPRIFDKSFVIGGSGSGITGLEMALVKTIIDRMGGQVWVGGQDRKGSTIYICLPTVEPDL